jgi:hypothetical protein
MDPPRERDGRDFTVAASDRRRPGRVDYSNPHLISLLRGEASSVGPNVGKLPIGEVDSLSTARGIGVSVVLGVLAWAAIAVVLWLVL